MVPGPIMMLRTAVSNLAAEPFEQEERLRGMVVQEERLRGMVVQDELALDFANAFESLGSLHGTDMLDASTMADLRVLYDKFSVGPGDSLWSEGLDSKRWAEIRAMAAGLIERV